jgi:phosphoribosylformylglycinamidine synthase
VRQYDHEVQGATHIKPFCGSTGSGPNDAGVIWLYPHGGAIDSAVSIGCGLAPRISLHDPYLMAQFAVDEAIRNVVATGGDIDHTCLLDNFCWPDPVLSEKNPDGDEKLGQLVRTCKGLYDICTLYGTPLVSGKDSMKNDFRGKNAKGEELTISILPTLLVTAMSKATIKETQTSAFQKPNDLIYRIGIPSFGLTGSEFADHFFLTSESDVLPTIDPNANLALYRSIKKGGSQQMFSSIHDISDGGLICAVIESCFGNTLGCTIELTNPNQTTLFSEGPGQFVISISPDKETAFRTLFSDHNIQKLGSVTENPFVHITSEHNTHLNHPLDDFFHAWKEEL